MEFLRRQNYESLESENSWSRCGNSTKKTLVALSGICIVAVVALTVSQLPGTDPLNKNGNFLKSAGAENRNISKTQATISSGLLEGINLKSRGGRNYAAFYNIPYAEPSVGEFRFEPPRELTGKWADATQKGVKCAQMKSGESEDHGDEDCHYLTVYTPVTGWRQSDQDLLPVMVYLLGGAFVGGQASIYGGEYFMDKDVVLVLPESRFGIFGFLSTADDVVPGNMGFKDQTMALKWVQKNIKAFGGDPKRVTIFGNSSGSMSVHCHMMSNMSAGLFHGAISQSGSAIGGPGSTSLVALDPRGSAEALGRKVGCKRVTNSKKLVNCLKKVDVPTLLEAQDKLFKAIVVENVPSGNRELKAENVFLSDTPLNIMREGRGQQNIPWIIGVNSGEIDVIAATLNFTGLVGLLNSNRIEILRKLLDIEDDETWQRVRKFYFGGNQITMETRENFTNLVNDRLMVHPTYVAATLQANNNRGLYNSHVYLYWFSKRPIKSIGSFLDELIDPPYGVSHADEVQYLFPYAKFPYIGLDSVDFKMSETMVNLWAEFATTGVAPHKDWTPMPPGQPFHQGPINWFQLDDELKMTGVVQNRMDFWNTFPPANLYLQDVNYA